MTNEFQTNRPIQVKNGREFWALLEKTARQVESWPEWKTGSRGPERKTNLDRRDDKKTAANAKNAGSSQ